MKARRYRRRRRLIKPRLQLRLIASFVGLATLALLLQFVFLGHGLTRAAAGMEGPGGQLAGELPRVLLVVLALSMACLLPTFLILGTILTFRIAGPVYRFEQYLGSVIRGDQLGPCVIRRGDELHELCELINDATLPLRQDPALRAGRSEEDPTPRTAG